MTRSVSPTFLATMALLCATAASAQVVTITPSNPQGWSAASYGVAGATAAITTTYPRSGSGSLEISLADDLNSEADFLIDYPTTNPLSSLTDLQYDWLRSSSSTMADGGIGAPAFALHMDGAFDDYLIYEPYYNSTPGPVTMDTWNTSNMLGGIFWRSTNDPTATGSCSSANAYITLAAFNTACYGGNAAVRGIDLFLGYGYTGTFDGAEDNVVIGFDGATPTTYNFEPDAVSATPEPASLALMATGLIGLAGVVRRRNRR